MFMDSEVVVTSETLYCICQSTWDSSNREFMICCDCCGDWLHGRCIDIKENDACKIKRFHCPRCVDKAGPSIYYTEGSKKNRVRCSPDFVEKLKKYSFASPKEVVQLMKGKDVNLCRLISKGFFKPILINTKEGLNLKVPPDSFLASDIKRIVGAQTLVDVIDVQNQNDMIMSLENFVQYFDNKRRPAPLNLISLEVSNTDLSDVVVPPEVVRQLDWLYKCWPTSKNNLNTENRPYVEKYCLISCADSYTDFHIDFGGTSVWYHVLWGEKIFYLIAPNEENLNLYSRWLAGEFGDDSFLADEVKRCYKLNVRKGQTLLIPTGWIHAVYTPHDSLVFGGNFVHMLNMELQLKIYDMEKEAMLKAKYLYPLFETAHWYAGQLVIDTLKEFNDINMVPPHLLEGSKALLRTYKSWSYLERDHHSSSRRREPIPVDVDYQKLIRDLEKQISSIELKQQQKKQSASTSRRSEPQLEKLVPAATDEVGNIAPLKVKIKLNRPSTSLQASVRPKTEGIGGESSSEGGVDLQAESNSGYHEADDSDSDVLKIDEGSLRRKKSKTKSKKKSEDGEHRSKSKKKHRHHHHHHKHQGHHRHHHRKHHHHSRHRHKTAKDSSEKALHVPKDDKNMLNNALAGALMQINELVDSANYKERIANCRNTPDKVKESVAELVDMDKSIIISKKQSEKKHSHLTLNGSTEDGDFVYFPITPGDENENNSRKGGKDEDRNWTPNNSRLSARKDTAKRNKPKPSSTKSSLALDEYESLEFKKSKMKNALNEMSGRSSNLHNGLKRNCEGESLSVKKPKKGMATPKQRLGKILKLKKSF